MPDPALLDRPVWQSLHAGWAPLAEGDALARRVRPDHNVFAAARDTGAEAQAALARLVPAHGELWLVEPDPWTAPPGCRIVRTAAIVQMVHDGATALPPTPAGAITLGEDDGSEMLALATLCRPGPYVQHTGRLGRFVGIRRGGRLIAMAGERMAVPGWREVSAVCSHPDARGQGLAAALIGDVVRAMAALGERAFLTSYADNAGAIALYERLGFGIRRTLTVSVVVHDI